MSMRLIERYFKKVVRDCKQAEGWAQTQFNTRNKLSRVETDVKAQHRQEM